MNHLTDHIQDLISRGAIFYCSHSGGKDSQAMYTYLRSLVPAEQIVVVHADLGEVEWLNVQEHIAGNIQHELNVVRATWADGSEKTLLGMVERRLEKRPDSPSWPSSAARFCTSDLKRDPIHKFIRQDLKLRGKLLAVNCTGLRAEESSSRAKKVEMEINKRLSKAGREVWEWLPIHSWTTEQVFNYIFDAGEQPFSAYGASRIDGQLRVTGNERLSCVFCVMGSRNDIAHGAQERPELFRKYREMEIRTGYTMFRSETLEERAGIRVTDLIAIAA